MPKTFYEVYKPKSPDEQKFVDKHITVKHADRNGNGDDLFNAKNIKKVKRSKEGHGYESGEDAKVYEDLEAIEASLLEYFDEIGQEVSYEELQELAVGLQGEVLNELSKPLLGRYVRNASFSKADAAFTTGALKAKEFPVAVKKAQKTEYKRTAGIDKALDRLTNNRYGVKEETQLDELSNQTLKSYIKKAGRQAANHDDTANDFYQKSKEMKGETARNMFAGGAANHAIKSVQRFNGMKKAFGKLTKENLDNIINRYNKEEISLEEAVLEKIAHLSEKHQSLIITLFDTLSEDNQELLFQTLDDEDGINETIDFALEAQLNEETLDEVSLDMKQRYLERGDKYLDNANPSKSKTVRRELNLNKVERQVRAAGLKPKGHYSASIKENLDESFIAGTRKISSHEGKDGHTHEIRYDRDNEEYSVHHYKDGKHLGEGPVSYHSDKEEAKDQVAYDVKNFKR